MKKGLFLIIAVLIFMLCACGKPEYMTQETYDIGCQALEIMEAYNDFKITAEDAERRMEPLKQRAATEYYKTHYTVSYSTLERTNALFIETYISFFLDGLKGYGDGTIDAEERMRDVLEK